MKNQRFFNWDTWIQQAKYTDVISQIPLIPSRRTLPTSFAPNDPNFLYVNSIDEELDISNLSVLKSALVRIVEKYISSLNNNSLFGRDALHLAFIQFDFEIICMIVQNEFGEYLELFNDEFESNVMWPQDLFKEMYEKFVSEK